VKVRAGGVGAEGCRWPSTGSQALSGGLCFVKALHANSPVQLLSPSAAFWPPGPERPALIAAVVSSERVGRTRRLAQFSLQGQRQGQLNFTSKIGGSSSCTPAQRGLTPPSSRAPTAKHLGRATVHCRLYCSAAQALRCWCRLMSNVRRRRQALLKLRRLRCGILAPCRGHLPCPSQSKISLPKHSAFHPKTEQSSSSACLKALNQDHRPKPHGFSLPDPGARRFVPVRSRWCPATRHWRGSEHASRELLASSRSRDRTG